MKSRTAFFIKITLFILIGLLGFSVVRLLILFPWSPEKLIRSDPLEPCDLIVFLDGEIFERIDYSFSLAEKGFSHTIYTPGTRYEKSRELIKKKMEQDGSAISIYVGNGTQSTYEEAVATKHFVIQHGLTSLILVTSPYHSFRAKWIFERIMPKIKIISAPVPMDKSWFDIRRVAENGRDQKAFRSEQKKFLLYYFLYGLIPGL